MCFFFIQRNHVTQHNKIKKKNKKNEKLDNKKKQKEKFKIMLKQIHKTSGKKH